MSGVVLVHGGWHGALCWEELTEELSAREVSPLVAIDLPFTGLDGDVATARSVVDGMAASTGSSVVLVGHSCGGLLVGHPTAGARVSHHVT